MTTEDYAKLARQFGDPVVPFKDYVSDEWVNYHGHIADMTFKQAQRFIPLNTTFQNELRSLVDRGEKPGYAVMKLLTHISDK